MLRVDRVRVAALAAAAVAGVAFAGVAQAANPVAIVEDVQGAVAGIGPMDYLEKGRRIALKPADVLIVGYLQSCAREVITGGSVTIGDGASTVAGGKVERSKTDCDGGKLQLSAAQAGKSGAIVFRKPADGGKAEPLPEPQLTVYGQSPVVELDGGKPLVIERLDRPGEKLEFATDPKLLLGGRFLDLARAQRALSPGGLYRASTGSHEVIFRVDPFAQPGKTPLLGRLIRL